MAAKRTDALENRERLLTVARAQVKAGDAVISFNELAKMTGVGVGTVYRHFADQRELLFAIAETEAGELAALTARAKAEKDFLAALEHLLLGVVRLQLSSPAIAEFFSEPKCESGPFAAELQALEDAGETILARGRKAKVFRADLRRGDLRRLLCGLDQAVRKGDEKQRAASRYVAILLAGLRRPS